MTALPNSSFVPLAFGSPAQGGQADFRLLVVSNPENAKPLRDTIPVPGAQPPCDPRVTLQREGDRITAIKIQCSCGQVIDLTCAY